MSILSMSIGNMNKNTNNNNEPADKNKINGVERFARKYFMEGQKLEEKQKTALKSLPDDAPFLTKLLVKHRRLVGILIPVLLVETLWWLQALKHDYFSYFTSARSLLSLTMVFGATVAGMSSEGGGSVAFPVMTLALEIQPGVARDFSLMIQSVGMSAAAFTIWWMQIKVEQHSVVFCSAGAVAGMVTGLELIDPILTSEQKKLGFVCIWFSFAFALFLLNREHKRRTFDKIQKFGAWQAAVLVGTGFLGGIFSAVSGSGVDICSFSVLTLLFRVSEKVTTPTSIVLMAINTCVGFYWRQFMTVGGAEEEAWGFLIVCVPIVVVFAPLGSIISSHFHRQVLAAFVYITDTAALVTGLVVVPLTLQLGIMSGCLLLAGFCLFFLMSKAGQWLLLRQEER